ncbi:MAG: type IV secretion system DNA-binding domain-containing protein [Cyanobacteria bacterium P01_G01_bin.38]
MMEKLSEFLGGMPPSQIKLLLIAGVGIIIVLLLGDSNKGKLAKSRKGGKPETKAARKYAVGQMLAGIHNQVAFTTAPVFSKGKQKHERGTLYISDAQRGTAVVGSANSGKTYSVIDPICRSAISQGMPIILYDFKYPDQTGKVAAYAKSQGYEVHIFAPGFEESGQCNLLDFMENEADGLMARQIATTLNTNMSTGKGGNRDEFFGDAGDQLVQAVLQLAKSLPYPDLLTASTLLGLHQLPQRIIKAKERSDQDQCSDWSMSLWVYMAFSQLLQLKDSEKTVGGVLGTASKVFSKFMVPELMGAFSGTTTIPLSMHGRKLLIFGLDQHRREAISPLLAATLHMVVARSLYEDRTEPLALILDELPSIRLPHLVKWLNESRYKGLCAVLGFQNIGQLEDAYGKGITQAIMGACATKAIFNPQDKTSAQYFSEYLGQEEIRIRQKSRGYGKSGSSRNVSMNASKRPLVEAAELNRFPIGKMVFLNPGYSSDGEAYVPMVLKGRVPKKEAEKAKLSTKAWPKLRAWLARRSGVARLDRKDIERRFNYLNKMFSLEDVAPPVANGHQTATANKHTAHVKNPALLKRLMAEAF